MIRIVGVGDIMPGGLLSGNGRPCIDDAILGVLLDGDIRCGTLECALGNEPTYDEEKVKDRGNVIYAKDTDIARLKELHMDVVSLANNHFFDLGIKGARHTIELLDAKGIMHCGAGDNLMEAGKPAVMAIHGKKVAFLGFCDTEYTHVYWCTYATENTPGVNPMKKDYVINEIKKNAALYDYVVVLAHWGTEHTFFPNISTVKMAKWMLDAGACLVLGSHPHRIQPVMNTRKGSVVYSMGNFLFPERLIAPPKVTWYPDSPIDYSSLPVTEDYPLVDCVTLKTLPFWARVGLVVVTDIEESSTVSNGVVSYLDATNHITRLADEKSRMVNSRVSHVGFWMKIGLYHPYYMIRKVFRAVLARFKRVLR